MALTSKLAAIGDAIREKTGTSEKMTLDQMPTAIQSIQTGAGGSNGEYTISQWANGEITDLVDPYILEIPDYFFYCDTSVQTLDCANVTKVGLFCFSNSNITKVYLPNATVLSGRVFMKAKSLAEVYLPKIVEISQGYNFYETQLTSIRMDELIKGAGSSYSSSSYDFYNCTKLTEAVFPKLQWCGENFMWNCNSLKKLDFGSLSNGIGGAAFYSCSSLNTLILRYADGVPALSNKNAFTSTPIALGTGYIYVPQDLVEQYKEATNWSLFADQIRAIEDYPEICG